jgi:hypothetical protein
VLRDRLDIVLPRGDDARMDPSPPPELTSHVLSIRRKGGRLVLATPVGRHALWSLPCLALPLLFWLFQWLGMGKGVRLSDGIEQPWLAFLADHVLPDPTAVPLQMNLVALALALIGIVLLGHRMKAVIGRDGITTTHSFCHLPYWQVRVARRDLLAYRLEQNGSFMQDGQAATLYAIKAECALPSEARFCGFIVTPLDAHKGAWLEWITFSLPGIDAGEYVLALVQEACPAPRSDAPHRT